MSEAVIDASGRTPIRWRPGLQYWLTVYKRVWRGSIFTSVLQPVLFLAAMGLGLGSYVHGHGQAQGQVEGFRYIVFLAPGLLASGGMQTGMGEAAWPVMGAVKWTKSYTAMTATTMTARDVFAGHFVYMLLRVAINSAIFSLVIVAFGLAQSPQGILLGWLATILIGAAFASCIAAFAVRQEQDSRLSFMYRFGLVPLFLFSGTFFPISQLPSGIRWLAWITPLWHGVALTRGIELGQGSVGPQLGHVAYLVAMTVIGCLLAARSYRKRLEW